MATDRENFDVGAVALRAAATPAVRRDLERGLRLLAKKGITSYEALIAALARSRGVTGWTAIRLLEFRGRSAVPALVPLLAGEDDMLRGEASKALANLGGARALRGCIRLLESTESTAARYAATYALAFMRDDRAANALTSLVLDQREAPEVRGQAAEGLDYLGREGGPHRRLAARTAVRGLKDRSPVVRFWCAFALGAMPYPRAIPLLRDVARRDKAVCPGWWRVCDEAADAIAIIEGRPPADRTPTKR